MHCSQETFFLSRVIGSNPLDPRIFGSIGSPCVLPWRGELDYKVIIIQSISMSPFKIAICSDFIRSICIIEVSEDSSFVDIKWKKLVHSSHCVDVIFLLDNMLVLSISQGFINKNISPCLLFVLVWCPLDLSDWIDRGLPSFHFCPISNLAFWSL